MKISELPQGIKEKALEYQRDENDKYFNKETDDLEDAFDWRNTTEGHKYWFDLDFMRKIDTNVQNVIDQFKQRSDVGFKKYGVTTERKDIDLLGWLQHLQEELMDATIYIERLKKEYESTNSK